MNMTDEIVRQLKLLKRHGAEPRAEWLEKNRGQLLAQIRNTVAPAPAQTLFGTMWAALSVLLPERLVYDILRPVAVLVVVALVGTSGWIATVDASYEALPGDWLYSAKRVAEKTQVAVAAIIGDKNGETKLHIEFARRRAVEARTVLGGQASAQKSSQARAAIADLKTEIASVSSNLEAGKYQPGSLPSQVAKDIKQNSEQIKNVLQDVKDNLLVSTSTNDKLLSKEISETKNLVRDVSVKAVEVLVSKHLEGDQSVSQADVQQAINSTLQSAAKDAVESKQTVDGAKNMVQTAQTEVKDLVKEQKNQIGEAASSTRVLANQISSVANQTVRDVIKTEAASAEVDKKINEAQKLLGNNDFIQAVDKAKEAASASQEVEKISDAAVANVQTVLPVIAVSGGSLTSATNTLVLILPAPATSTVNTTPKTTTSTDNKK